MRITCLGWDGGIPCKILFVIQWFHLFSRFKLNIVPPKNLNPNIGWNLMIPCKILFAIQWFHLSSRVKPNIVHEKKSNTNCSTTRNSPHPWSPDTIKNQTLYKTKTARTDELSLQDSGSHMRKLVNWTSLLSRMIFFPQIWGRLADNTQAIFFPVRTSLRSSLFL